MQRTRNKVYYSSCWFGCFLACENRIRAKTIKIAVHTHTRTVFCVKLMQCTHSMQHKHNWIEFIKETIFCMSNFLEKTRGNRMSNAECVSLRTFLWEFANKCMTANHGKYTSLKFRWQITFYILNQSVQVVDTQFEPTWAAFLFPPSFQVRSLNLSSFRFSICCRWQQTR